MTPRERPPSVSSRAAAGLSCLLLLALPVPAADVVLNEIMYHPAGGEDLLQYVELHNHGQSAADLSGWSFTRGIRFTFPAPTTLAAGAYLVVCRDHSAFAARYGESVKALGGFAGSLSHDGERLELADASGVVVDWVRYDDEAPWPAGADGYSGALERLSPLESARLPENWIASSRSPAGVPAGTPGSRNERASSNLPPAIAGVQFQPPAPGAALKVTASVADPDGVKEVVLLYRLAGPGKESEEKRVAMERIAGDERRGTHAASVEAQPEGTLIRFRLKAVDAAGGERTHPSPTEPRPTFSAYVLGAANAARIPVGFVLRVGGEPTDDGAGGEAGPGDPERRAFRGAFIHVPPGDGPVETFDHLRIVSSRPGLKLRFQRDRPFQGMTVANLIAEGPRRWLLAEALAYEVYRLAGVPAPRAQPIRLWKDGRLLGYQLLVEQPNRSFLARHRRDLSGNLYKVVWYGRDLIAQHEKKRGGTAGHEDLLALVEALKDPSEDGRWRVIREHFNVEEVAGYFAASMCISDWDGFHNNYFAYHDLGRTGKWELYPWDKDKTWGDYDGAAKEYDWYEMPLTVGMQGDRSPPLDPASKANNLRGYHGGVGWWRKGGWFSRPLLANPPFRKLFLARLGELCATVFTEEKLLPVIDALERDLGPEVPIRAGARGEDEEEAKRVFKEHLDSFRRQVQHRRQFILAELKKAP